MRRSGIGHAHRREQVLGELVGELRVTSRCVWIDSVIWLPIFITGFSDVIGSWKTIAMCAPQ